MLPAKKIVDRAFEDGTIDKVSRLLSAAHILNMESDILVEEASDALDKAGLRIGMLKKLHSEFIKRFDIYCREFAEMIPNQEVKRSMFHDLEDFDKRFRKWSKLTELGNIDSKD